MTARNVRAETAREDAMDLACDVRLVDPKVLWQRLMAWQRTDPNRVAAVAVALAAMVPIDTPVHQLLAWTDGLVEAG